MTEYKMFESEVDISKLSTKHISDAVHKIERDIDRLEARKAVLVQEMLRRGEGNVPE